MKLELMEIEEFLIRESESSFAVFEYSKFGLKTFDMFIKEFKTDLKELSYFSTKALFTLMINYKKDRECLECLNQEYIKKFLKEENLLDKQTFAKEFLLSFAFDFYKEEEFKTWFLKQFCREGISVQTQLLLTVTDDKYKKIEFDYGLNLNINNVLLMEDNYSLKNVDKSVFNFLLSNWLKEYNPELIPSFSRATLSQKLFFIEYFLNFYEEKEANKLVELFLDHWSKSISSSEDRENILALKVLSLLDTTKKNEKLISRTLLKVANHEKFKDKGAALINVKEEFNFGIKLKNPYFIDFYRMIGIPIKYIKRKMIFSSQIERKALLFKILNIDKNSTIDEIKFNLKELPVDTIGELIKEIPPNEIFRLAFDFPAMRTFLSIGGTRLTSEEIDLCFTILSHKIALSDKDLNISSEEYDVLLLNYKY